MYGNEGKDTLTGGAGVKDTAWGGIGKDTCSAETAYECE